MEVDYRACQYFQTKLKFKLKCSHGLIDETHLEEVMRGGNFQFGRMYHYCHNFKYFEGKELVQGGGYNFLPCEVVDKFNCIQDQAFKAEVENVIRGLAREATNLLKNFQFGCIVPILPQLQVL